MDSVKCSSARAREKSRPDEMPRRLLSPGRKGRGLYFDHFGDACAQAAAVGAAELRGFMFGRLCRRRMTSVETSDEKGSDGWVCMWGPCGAIVVAEST